MMIGFGFWAVLLWVPSVLLSADRPFWNTGANLIRAVVLLGGIGLFGRQMGFMSAALAYAASTAVWALCSGILVLKLKNQHAT